MRRLFLPIIFLSFFSPAFAAIKPLNGERSINDIPNAREALLRAVSPRFYKTLLISPVKGWVVVRGQLSGTQLFNTELIHSELDGKYDELALDLANNLQVRGNSNFGALTNRTML